MFIVKRTDPKGNSIEMDMTGIIVFVLSVFLFVPFIFIFGFTMPTWTLLAVLCVGAIHFIISFVSSFWKSVGEEIREEKEKKESENSPGE